MRRSSFGRATAAPCPSGGRLAGHMPFGCLDVAVRLGQTRAHAPAAAAMCLPACLPAYPVAALVPASLLPLVNLVSRILSFSLYRKASPSPLLNDDLLCDDDCAAPAGALTLELGWAPRRYGRIFSALGTRRRSNEPRLPPTLPLAPPPSPALLISPGAGSDPASCTPCSRAASCPPPSPCRPGRPPTPPRSRSRPRVRSSRQSTRPALRRPSAGRP
jgi:hypothetical protein